MKQLILLLLILTFAVSANQELLTNQDVIDMIKAGLGQELVAKKITSGNGVFEMSPKSMIELKKNDVPDSLIELMLQESMKTKRKLRAKIAVEIQNLASDDPELKRKAYFYLKRLGHAALPQMRDALGTNTPALRAGVAKALGDFNDLESVNLLRELLRDKNENVRYAAAYSLALMKDELALTTARKTVASGVSPLDGYIKLLGLRKDIEYTGFIGMRLLKNPDEKTRAVSAWALGEIKSDQGLMPLEEALVNDRSIEVKKAAAISLGKLHKDSSFNKLARIGSEFPKVREEVLTAIGNYPAAKSVPFLIAVMDQTFDAKQKKIIQNALRRHTSRDFGDDIAAWKKWLNKNKSSLGKE